MTKMQRFHFLTRKINISDFYFFFFSIIDSIKFLLITDTYNSFTLNIVNLIN